MLIRVTVVEVCDATTADSSIAAGNKMALFFITFATCKT